MKIDTDWHIHSRNSCECHQIGSSGCDLQAAIAAKGIADFGLSDHLHSRYNLPDIAAARLEFLACDPPPHFHFGIEVTCMRRWELDQIDAGNFDPSDPPIYGRGQDGPLSEPAIALTGADADALGIEYAVGGVHWARGIEPDPAAIVDFFHSQMLFLAAHPLIDIVAHPWWWHDHFKRPDGTYVVAPWVDGFAGIPHSCHDEFAAVMAEHGTAAEINPGWILARPFGPNGFEPYLDYLRMLRERGVSFSVGSDCHSRYGGFSDESQQLLEQLGIDAGDLFRLPPRRGSMPGCAAESLLDALGLQPDDLWCNRPA